MIDILSKKIKYRAIMNLKPNLKEDECCYLFIFENSLKCDFAILTDELCLVVGGVFEYTEVEYISKSCSNKSIR